MQKRRWKAAEVAELTRRYETEGPTLLASDLGRSPFSVMCEAYRLGTAVTDPADQAVLDETAEP